MSASVTLLLLVPFSISYTQTGPTLIGTGYNFASRTIAPGQVVRLQVAGLKLIPLTPDGFYRQTATSVPLPTTLAGISLTVTQYVRHALADTPTPVGPFQVPLLDVTQSNNCYNDNSPDCFTTVLTVQMPYELSDLPNIFGARQKYTSGACLK
jgi:hypothetical protein